MKILHPLRLIYGLCVGFGLLIMPIGIPAQAKVHRVNGLGTSVGQPALTYLRIRDKIRAVLITGCGDDPNAARGLKSRPNAPGRCMLVLRADTGEVIRKFTNGSDVKGNAVLGYPILGGVTAYPNSGTLASDRAYVGDTAGQLWRMDFRDPNPAQWSVSIAWPAENALETGQYRLGRAIVAAPSVSLARNGSLTVIFGTGDDGPDVDGVSSMMVSVAEDVVLTEGGTLQFETKRNWIMPFRTGESLRGEPTVRNGTAFFTTLEQSEGADQCVGTQARLYAVDYTKSQSGYDTLDGRNLTVVPRLPPVKIEGGNIVTDGIAFVLPSGLSLDGLAIIRSPSCAEEQEPTTEIVLNYAASEPGNFQTDVQVELQRGDLVDEPVDRDLVRKGGQDVAIALALNTQADAPQNRGDNSIAPFPRRVLYWGSSLTD